MWDNKGIVEINMQTEAKKETEYIILRKSKGSCNRPTDQLVNQKGIYSGYVKRPMDFILSSISLIILSPVMLIIAILVRIKLGSPIIFKQQRPGLNEKIFTMYKFRTMTDERDKKNGDFLPNHMRLTKLGKVLRSTSLDELPELFNILRGDMSIVGPRPLLPEYLTLYNKKQKHRHDVRPGLTGLAQVNGRNAINWEDKFDYDIKYAKNISFKSDCKIIVLTAKKILLREGIYYKNSDYTYKFKGN